VIRWGRHRGFGLCP